MDAPEHTPILGPAWKAAEAYGVDMSLLEESLRMTPVERTRANARALVRMLDLRRAMKQEHA